MGSLPLPERDSPTLTLVQPTEDEKIAQWKLNGTSWKGALPNVESYVAREAYLEQQELTRNGGLTLWVLVDIAAKNRQVLCGCDTYRKKAMMWKDGRVKDVVSYGIGSVFCPPDKRGKGYAGRMMKELGKILKTWKLADGEQCLFTTLYSDIGKKFYANHGWNPYPSSYISVPASFTLPQSLPAVRALYAPELAELCTIDENLVRQRLELLPKDSKTTVALTPDVATIRWLHAREEFVGREVYHKVPDIKGALVGTEKGGRVWAIFTRMWYNSDPKATNGNILYFLRLVIEDKVTDEPTEKPTDFQESKHTLAIAAIIAFALNQVKEWGMEEVQAWNPTADVVAAAKYLYPEAKAINRDEESIASLMWYGTETGNNKEDVDWIECEKYVWC
ncbi:hypothetical protein M501DRAFT_968590 [Patellaria atrata CBS 101060]|uniref:LYC1 C-terminal domain-containing protein n=1 Tax=Patellaria atrata CBS 101060 TaxID=1346257 RepID=A0A9P4SG27_9PEZI|nr:hypothetical protein M501DRAFT_968590 [Patellaria atrata CBS 101060]